MSPFQNAVVPLRAPCVIQWAATFPHSALNTIYTSCNGIKTYPTPGLYIYSWTEHKKQTQDLALSFRGLERIPKISQVVSRPLPRHLSIIKLVQQVITRDSIFPWKKAENLHLKKTPQKSVAFCNLLKAWWHPTVNGTISVRFLPQFLPIHKMIIEVLNPTPKGRSQKEVLCEWYNFFLIHSLLFITQCNFQTLKPNYIPAPNPTLTLHYIIFPWAQIYFMCSCVHISIPVIIRGNLVSDCLSPQGRDSNICYNDYSFLHFSE